MDQSKQPEPRRATTGTRVKSMRHKAILAERFRHARRACWLTVPRAAKLLHVSVRTVHNWGAGIVRVPFAAYKAHAHPARRRTAQRLRPALRGVGRRWRLLVCCSPA
jgi:DNA-binding transcriptional regulator YiaG